jgi:large subunit ribosomal protein L31e
MKTEEVKLNEKLNQELWKRGAERPMSRIRVRAVKQDDGSVEAFPAATRPKEEETSE